MIFAALQRYLLLAEAAIDFRLRLMPPPYFRAFRRQAIFAAERHCRIFDTI
jgi:hypothetical protein